MKKFVAILLCLVMVLAIVACKKTEIRDFFHSAVMVR